MKQKIAKEQQQYNKPRGLTSMMTVQNVPDNVWKAKMLSM